MKQKLIIKGTGNCVEVGDIIEVHYCQTKKDGTRIVGVAKNTLTEKNIPRLIRKGILAVQTFGQPTGYEEVPTDLQYYYKKVLDSITNSDSELVNLAQCLNTIIEYHPSVVFQLLLRQIAIELDHRYEGDISKSDKIFGVGLTDGKVIELNKESIKNFRNFAAFRTPEDAEFAKNILSGYMKLMYDYKQKD